MGFIESVVGDTGGIGDHLGMEETLSSTVRGRHNDRGSHQDLVRLPRGVAQPGTEDRWGGVFNHIVNITPRELGQLHRIYRHYGPQRLCEAHRTDLGTRLTDQY